MRNSYFVSSQNFNYPRTASPTTIGRSRRSAAPPIPHSHEYYYGLGEGGEGREPHSGRHEYRPFDGSYGYQQREVGNCSRLPCIVTQVGRTHCPIRTRSSNPREATQNRTRGANRWTTGSSFSRRPDGARATTPSWRQPPTATGERKHVPTYFSVVLVV